MNLIKALMKASEKKGKRFNAESAAVRAQSAQRKTERDPACRGWGDAALFCGDGGAVEAILQGFIFAADFGGETVAENFEEFRGGVGFFGPIVGVHAKQFIHNGSRNCQSIEAK